MPDNLTTTTESTISSLSNLTSSSSTTSNALEGTLFPPIIKAFTEFWDTALTVESKNNLVLGMNLFVLGLIIYLAWQFINHHISKNKPRYSLKITTQPNFLIKNNLGSEMFVLVSKIHKLAKGSVVTFEIHKTLSDQFFLVTTSSQSLLEQIQSELKKISGLGFGVLESASDISTLDSSQLKPYQLQLSSSSKFGLFKKAEFRIIGNVCSFLTSLTASQTGSVVVAFKPNYLTYKVKSEIAKLTYKAKKDSKEYGTDLSIIEDIKNLNDKKTSEMFTTKITVIGSTSSVVDQLASCFGLLNSDNKFNEKMTNYDFKSIRHVSNSPVIFQKSSNLNCSELSSIVHFANFGNQEIVNSVVVDQTIVNPKFNHFK
jgi:hypothetical protein